METVSREIYRQHTVLLTKLCDMMDPNDQTYKNFIFYLRDYIPWRRLCRIKQDPTTVFNLMEKSGVLKVGKYQVLKEALEAVGYINILDLLKDEEERITRQMRKRSYRDGPMAGSSSSIEAMTAQFMESKDTQPSTISTVEVRLQKDLLYRYKFQNVIPISPLHESYTTLLDDIYTSVIIEKEDNENVGHWRQRQLRNSKDPTYLKSFHQLFGGKGNKRLILKGFMGSGKSVFCRKVVQTWCRVKTNQVDPESAGEIQVSSTNALDDEDILSQFEFLFFIDLSKINIKEDLLHAIHRQCSIPNDIENKSFLRKLLQNVPEKILIILDGLDEIGSQSPGFVNDLLERQLYPRIVVLVSTRPWQVSKLGLQAHSHYDLLLTVHGFDEKGALDFATKVIHAHDKAVSDRMVKDMAESLTKKKLFATFKSVPLLLLFLINVWYTDKSLPDQYSVLYSKIIDCMITSYLNKTKGKNLKWVEMSDVKIIIMESSVFVKTFGNAFLRLISKLSYNFLLQRQHGATVIISREKLLESLDNDGKTAESKLFALLDCGILSKSDAPSPLERNYSVSFLHLTIQEFLSAIHLILNEDVFQEFLSSWTCLDDVLQNENLVIFICGLAPNIGTLVFSRICDVCDHDPKVLEYRYDSVLCTYRYAIENLCSLYRICLNEVKLSVSLLLSDIRIKASLIENESEEFLFMIMKLGLTSAIKSFNLFNLLLSTDSSESLCKTISSCTNLQSLDLEYITLHDSVLDMNRLASLTYLRLQDVTMSMECSKSLCISVSNCTNLQFLNLQNIKLYDSTLDLGKLTGLTNLKLWNVTMSCEFSESLCKSISNNIHLQTLHLITITLHDSVLDLSRLTRLINLTLWSVTMSCECIESLCRCISNCTSLQTLHLDCITFHDTVLDLSRLTDLNTLRLWQLNMSIECSRSLCRSISTCTRLKSLHLIIMTLHDSILDLNILTSLSDFVLWDVTMSSECSKSICSSVSNCTHLQNLDLQEITLHDGILDLSRLTGLTKLELRSVTMSSECSESLCRSISNCTHLQNLDLQEITLHDGVLDLSRLTGLTNLMQRNVTMSSQCSNTLCRSIHNCVLMQALHLEEVTLHDSILDLSTFTNMTNLVIMGVRMSSPCHQVLNTSVKALSNLLLCKIEGLTISADSHN